MRTKTTTRATKKVTVKPSAKTLTKMTMKAPTKKSVTKTKAAKKPAMKAQTTGTVKTKRTSAKATKTTRAAKATFTPAKSGKAVKATDFKLTDRAGKAYSLSSFKGAWTVLYFYPKDDTPGCTVEAIEFESAMSKFKKAKIDVVGISGGDDKTKAKFCKKHGLTFPLLSDPTFKTAKAYGAYGKKTFMGRTFNGILRMTFVLNKAKQIVKVFETVKPETHATEVWNWIKTQK